MHAKVEPARQAHSTVKVGLDLVDGAKWRSTRLFAPPSKAWNVRWSLALVLLTLISGCIQDHAPRSDPPQDPPPSIVRFRGDEVLPQGANLGVPSYVLLGHNGAEPTMGVTSDGSIFVVSNNVVMRSQDGALSWAIVFEHPLQTQQDTVGPTDPMLWVDTVTDRIYTAPSVPIGVCLSFHWSDDFGASWTPAPSPLCGHGVYDHQKVMTATPGPETNPLAGQLWPTVVYSCYNSAAVSNCAVSYDGGMTWPIDRPVHANTLLPVVEPGVAHACSSGQMGHPASAPDGTVVFARHGPNCPALFLSISRDSGLTWEYAPGPLHSDGHTTDPEVAFTPNGSMYVLYQSATNQPLLGRSMDFGASWQEPWTVSPPGVHLTAFQALSTGSDGRLAMAFLGTNDTSMETLSDLNSTARWHLYIVTSETADEAQPTFVSYQVTPDDDPVHIGCIEMSGDSTCRNMLEFIDSAAGPDGTFHVAYTEGCVSDACRSPGATRLDSLADMTAVGILNGWSLYGPTV